MFHVPEYARVRTGVMASDARAGNNGAFDLRSPEGRRLAIIASDGRGWEHVSVHAYIGNGKRQWTPTWDEMCFVKSVFWDAEDVVIQFHPAESKYVNNHPHTLHLWRPTSAVLPVPPAYLVGIPRSLYENLPLER